MYNLTTELIRRGATPVKIVCFGDHAKRDSFARFDAQHSIPVVRITNMVTRFRAWVFGMRTPETMSRAYGVVVSVVDGMATTWALLWVVCGCIRRFSERTIVLHCHDYASTFVGVIARTLFPRSQIRILFISSSDDVRSGSRFFTRIVSWTVRHADHSLCVSRALARGLVERFDVPADRVSVYYSWIDLGTLVKEFGAIDFDRSTDDKTRLLFAGRINREKGINELLTLVRHIDRAGLGNRYHLTIVGDSDLPIVDEVKRTAGASPSLTFVGRVDKPALWRYFASHDIFLMPSQCEEGFGNVILESYAFGMPVIGARRGGIPEGLEKFLVYSLLDSCEPEAMLAAIQTVRAKIDALGRRRLLEQSHAALVEYFSPKNFDIYQSVVDRLTS